MKSKFTDELIIQATKNTPLVKCHPNGILQFKGNSFPEDSGIVFDSLIEWVSQYVLKPAPKTEFFISIDHHNDITSTYLLKILKTLKQHCDNLVINWEYDEGDDDNVFLGTCLSESVDLDFVYIEKETRKINEFKWETTEKKEKVIEQEPIHEVNNNDEKPVLSIKDYFDFLLARRYIIDKMLKDNILSSNYFSGDQRLLNLEIKIFSLWVVSLALEDRRMKDMLHQRFCEEIGFVDNEIRLFYDQIKIRYDIYNDALGRFFDNPQSGHLLGSVMVEIIINQNHAFSIEENMPLTDGNQSLEMFVMFDSFFRPLLETIKSIKQKYILPTLN